MLSLSAYRVGLPRFVLVSMVLVGACWTAWPGQGDVPSTDIPHNGASVPVRSWLVSGDFPSPRVAMPPPEGPTGAGYDVDYLAPLGGESAARVQPDTTVAAPDGKTVAFNLHEWDKAYINLNQVSQAPRDVCVYLYAELNSAADQVVYAHVGTNSAGKVWVDGQEIVGYPGDRVAMPSQHVVRVSLKAGRTPVLLKIDHDGGGWGAFFEIYGQDAQAEYCKKNFPRQLAVVADDYLPDSGKRFSLNIADWVPPEPPASVSWELVDGDRSERLDFSGPTATVTVADGPERVLVLRATAPRPQGGEARGECVLLTGGAAAAAHTLERFEAIRNAAEDLAALSGPRRDAYAQALYRFERLTRGGASPNPNSLSIEDARSLVLLRTALDSFELDASPYLGKAGLFEGAYVADADGSAQPFMLSVPRTYDASRRYALLVYLHGAGQTHEAPNSWWQPAADAPYCEETIGVAVLGRGRQSGYEGLGERDVLDAVDWVQSHYNLDPDRVYLIGSSMGGGGTWRLAAQYPDRFAAAMADCGYPRFSLLPNLMHVPFYANHGDADTAVPVAWSRLGTGLLARLGSPVVYTEYPGVDHAVGIPVTAVGYMTRLAVHRRTAEPASIRIHAEHPRYARMYWGRIAHWEDPHAPAALDASVLPGNVVSVNLTNVAEACLRPPTSCLSADGDLTWLVGARRTVLPRSADGAYDLVRTHDGFDVRSHADEAPSETRPYVQGSYAELYRGEPLLIVYGTAAPEPGVREAIRNMALELSRMSYPGRKMEFGQIPVAADTTVTDEQFARHNLFLVGGPEQNAVTQRLMRQMPVREQDGALTVFESAPRPLSGCGYTFVYPNPEQPKRLILVHASEESSYYACPTGEKTAGPRIFDGSWRDPYIPDLSVEVVDPVKGNRYALLLRFTHGWCPEPDSPLRAARQPASELEYREMVAEVFRRATGASYALSPRGSADKNCPYDSAAMNWDGISMLIANRETLVFDVSGKQLLELSKPKEGLDWAFRPSPSSDDIVADARYRVAGPSDLLWAFGHSALAVQPRGVIDDPAEFETAAREVWQVR